ncbi:uncharacterized protein VTP21DRAFT_10485 [Calcarisporiella thermophila]|uniref:uncharacterized protein n=1 Tax=Calcarisporiella thermophila TaxID=911321 RepID=UPI0037427F30
MGIFPFGKKTKRESTDKKTGQPASFLGSPLEDIDDVSTAGVGQQRKTLLDEILVELDTKPDTEKKENQGGNLKTDISLALELSNRLAIGDIDPISVFAPSNVAPSSTDRSPLQPESRFSVPVSVNSPNLGKKVADDASSRRKTLKDSDDESSGEETDGTTKTDEHLRDLRTRRRQSGGRPGAPLDRKVENWAKQVHTDPTASILERMKDRHRQESKFIPEQLLTPAYENYPIAMPIGAPLHGMSASIGIGIDCHANIAPPPPPPPSLPFPTGVKPNPHFQNSSYSNHYNGEDAACKENYQQQGRHMRSKSHVELRRGWNAEVAMKQPLPRRQSESCGDTTRSEGGKRSVGHLARAWKNQKEEDSESSESSESSDSSDDESEDDKIVKQVEDDDDEKPIAGMLKTVVADPTSSKYTKGKLKASTAFIGNELPLKHGRSQIPIHLTDSIDSSSEASLSRSSSKTCTGSNASCVTPPSSPVVSEDNRPLMPLCVQNVNAANPWPEEHHHPCLHHDPGNTSFPQQMGQKSLGARCKCNHMPHMMYTENSLGASMITPDHGRYFSNQLNLSQQLPSMAPMRRSDSWGLPQQVMYSTPLQMQRDHQCRSGQMWGITQPVTSQPVDPMSQMNPRNLSFYQRQQMPYYPSYPQPPPQQWQYKQSGPYAPYM